MRKLIGTILIIIASTAGMPALGDTEKFVVMIGEKNVGHLHAAVSAARTTIDFDVKNNGRGPTIAETLVIDSQGLPRAWQIRGTTTFGSKVAESFTRTAKQTQWSDSSGKDRAQPAGLALYIGQSASPWALGVYARALLQQPEGKLAALPGGEVRLQKGETVSVAGAAGDIRVTRYAIVGIDLEPRTLLLDGENRLFAVPSPRSVLVREGYENAEQQLRELAAKWETERFVDIESRVAHRYAAPLRIRNVRLFDPVAGALTDAVSVVVSGNRIASVEPIDSPNTPGEVTIDGAGGTLIAGMTEMHAHLGKDDALLNVLAGITSVRDMGNQPDVLDKLIEAIDTGVIGGPRVVRSGFIEGKSPFSSNNGTLVDSEAKALDAVRWYAARGYWQIKIYNSINPAWVPAMVREAHKLGMRVAGHVPAFSTADKMIEAGYDEITHINQFMLGWVIKPTEDTRTLFRLTALTRLPALPLDSAAVQRTIQSMVDRKITIDPTIGIHENLTLNRDGQIPPGARDYFAHLPIGVQRDMTKAWSDASTPALDAAYRGAFDKIIDTLRILHERGVFIVPGTDTGGSFTYHRELELMQRIGMTPAEVLRRATFDVAQYLGQDQERGSIAKGKLADFFLVPGDPTEDLKAIKTISMVVKDGRVYFPTEAYPEFGIKPFVGMPAVTLPVTPQ